ncbi:MAG: S-layer homology domain-containing protein [Oscillospiraceae bacterium]|nr:S-layer homology domain-containing protein [Oscillospiraceae bacterium]
MKRAAALFLALVLLASANAVFASPAANASITVPSDAALELEEKNFSGYNYRSFDPVEPVFTEQNGDVTTYSFALTDGRTYRYHVSDDTRAPTVSLFRFNGAYEQTVTLSDSRTATVRDVSANGGYNVADVYMNVNAAGWLRLAAAGDTYPLFCLRSWQAVDDPVGNNFVEPDWHYTVLNENGAPDESVVTVSADGLITAVGEGTAIVLAAYDAMNAPGAAGGPLFGAAWQENTGVAVVTVGETGELATGMTVNAGENPDKLAGDSIDAELDVIYFTGDAGAYTFTPATAGSTVAVANPTVGDTVCYGGFTPLAENADGSVTVPLTEGRNIVRVTHGGDTAYQIVTAKKVTVTVNGGDPVHPGDALSIVFDRLYHPVNKLAGVYNMNAVAVYTDVGGADGLIAGGATAQYNFASSRGAQTVADLLTRKTVGFGNVVYQKTDALTVPADFRGETFTLSGGTVMALGFGDRFGEHRALTRETGKGANTNAAFREGRFGALPDIVIPVTVSDAALTALELETGGVKTAYYAGDAFDPEHLTVTARYEDGASQTVSSYTVSPETLTADTTAVTVAYRGLTAQIPVTVTQPQLTSIAVTTMPRKTAYTAGEAFDPNGMTVTATYENGAAAEIADYTYAPARELTAEDTLVTVSYGGMTATVPITVEASSAPQQTVTVTFSLLGDSAHGEGGETHTLKKNNLETWIAPTRVTVPAGATVLNVIEKALGVSGVAFQNPSGNYITSVRGLSEFDNGALSGWMYALNGTHPTNSVTEQTVRNGDRIVLHYSDDYTVESGSEVFSTPAKTEQEEKKPEQPEQPPAKKTYTDVPEDAWYCEAVDYVSQKGMMHGTAETEFSPDAPMTRAMLMTVLARYAGADTEGGATWYEKGMAWAVENGVSDGTMPEADVTREQLVTMLYRYVKKQGGGFTGTWTFSLDYTDRDQIAPWAHEAVCWCTMHGIVNGMGGGFVPRGSATRAQVAAILMRFDNLQKTEVS